ncbi:MAG: GDSL-type esterase/lipase family protein [Chitinophagaceae bacterium]
MNRSFSNIVIVFTFLLSSLIIHAQQMPANDNALAQKYPFVSAVFNRIFNSSGLDSFYQKLYKLKSTGSGTVSIVHIGDSHIQADFLTEVVRDGLQDFFGNAGRGLVFPYQLAQSNAPDDVKSSSDNNWQFNRLAHPEIPISYGISGYGIRTNNSTANIKLSLNPVSSGLSYFNRLKIFTDSNIANSWVVQADNNAVPYVLKKEESDSSIYHLVTLEQPSTSFSISSLPSESTKEFYGVSLENSKPGVLYHTIGVNGARYDQYNNASLFWQQLPALKADLYIISLGTNEAQFPAFNETVFTKQLTTFIEKIKQSSPGASILITTAPDSYKQRRPNAVLRSLNISLENYCSKNYIPFWDLYRITNGYGSAYSWVRRGLMVSDRIHFTPEGYRLQGGLLLDALGKGYNNYAAAR